MIMNDDVWKIGNDIVNSPSYFLYDKKTSG